MGAEDPEKDLCVLSDVSKSNPCDWQTQGRKKAGRHEAVKFLGVGLGAWPPPRCR